MSRVMDWLRNRNSVRNQIFFSILLFLIVPFLLTFYWVDNPLERTIERKIGESANEALHQVNFNVELFLESMMKSAIDISMNPTIDELLKHPERFTDYEKLRINDTVINKLFSSNFSEPYVTLLDLNGSWLSNKYMEEELYRQYTESAWFREMVHQPFQMRWMFNSNNYIYTDKQPLLTLVKTVTELQTSQNIGMILFSVRESDVRKYLSKLEGEVYLVDENGMIISSPDAKRIGTPVGDEPFMDNVHRQPKGQEVVERQRQKWFVNYDTVSQSGWKIVQLIPYDTVFKEIFDVRKANIAVVVVIFIVFMIITLFISYGISSPLKLLKKRMQEIEERDFNSYLSVSGPKEIATLLSTYNKMAKRIRDLLQRLREEYQQKEEIRFKALQAQINPHFILNTLNNIKWMAYIRNDREVGEMLSRLGSIMEASIGRGETLIPLKEEISYIQNYVELMKLKYNDKLVVKYGIPEPLLKVEAIKFMLQPLIENSILHGIEPLNGTGTIEVSAFEEDGRLKVTVKDNGVGMTQDKLLAEQARLAGSVDRSVTGSIGMKNVHDRVRLQYGEPYGLLLDSEVRAGTTVTLLLPLHHMEK
ncbi:sensor histidine kinase [Paenibacillus sp. NPDC056579]|uniref:sensor histidine kinase n=1 Tax=Paenibacillus sp. NPDC056579 TaxID=3345871 RepID=UPI003677CCA8